MASRARKLETHRRRHPVHYIKDEEFTNHLGGEEKLLVVVKLFSSLYQPLQQLRLDEAGVRKLNKALDVLEADPDEDGYYALEDEHFESIKAVVSAMMLNITIGNDKSFALDQPKVVDLLNAAPTVKPVASEPGEEHHTNGTGGTDELIETESVAARNA